MEKTHPEGDTRLWRCWEQSLPAISACVVNQVLTLFRHLESFHYVSCFLAFSTFQSCKTGSIGHPSSGPGTQAQPGFLLHSSVVVGDDTGESLISDPCTVFISKMGFIVISMVLGKVRVSSNSSEFLEGQPEWTTSYATSVNPALRRLTQGNCELQATLRYKVRLSKVDR